MSERQDQPVTVRGLTLDPVTNAPIVILKAEGGRRLLPIWIGLFEANAIALEMEHVATRRPMTHDLLKSIVEALGARVERAVVDNLEENTFHASIYLRAGDTERRLDARPSDAIALALRARAPIFVTRDVLDRSTNIEIEDELGDTDAWRRWLERITPGDFGTAPGTGGATDLDNRERTDRADG